MVDNKFFDDLFADLKTEPENDAERDQSDTSLMFIDPLPNWDEDEDEDAEEIYRRKKRKKRKKRKSKKRKERQLSEMWALNYRLRQTEQAIMFLSLTKADKCLPASEHPIICNSRLIDEDDCDDFGI